MTYLYRYAVNVGTLFYCSWHPLCKWAIVFRFQDFSNDSRSIKLIKRRAPYKYITAGASLSERASHMKLI